MEKKFNKKGQVAGITQVMLSLVITVAVIVLVLILTGVLGGQSYEIVEADIDAIGNETIRTKIKDTIVEGFDAQLQVAKYVPLFVIAVVMFVILLLITSLQGVGGGMSRGGAL